MIEFEWTCPECGCVNTDYYDLTIAPLCGVCNHSWYEWDEVIDTAPLNKRWIELEQQQKS
jgi:hypothetical protein